MIRGGAYCKAFMLRDLRRWDKWPQSAPDGLDDESIVYLQDDYSVTHGVLASQGIIYDGAMTEWHSFCRDNLEFRVPELGSTEAGDANTEHAR